MSLVKKEMVRNGDMLVPWYTYKCDRCGKELPESFPRIELGETDYCGDCAFILGEIDEAEYLSHFCYWASCFELRAVVRENKVYVTDSKFPWERTSRNRDCKSYREWRDSVYERDNFTCQRCKKRGGYLNAHHIKSYANYPSLRYEISNGITLCERCHREVHKEERRLKKV